MAHTSALHSLSQEDVLDTLRTQFTVQPDTLVNLTKTFLREAAQGLASYGLSMAMMYARSLLPIGYKLTSLSPTYVKQVPDGSETGCVHVPYLISPMSYPSRPTAPFSPSIWAELTCKLISYLRSVISLDKPSRACEVILHGNKTFTLRQQKYKVSEALKTGEATTLFGTDL